MMNGTAFPELSTGLQRDVCLLSNPSRAMCASIQNVCACFQIHVCLLSKMTLETKAATRFLLAEDFNVILTIYFNVLAERYLKFL
jgi:hypothetical protein